MFLDSRHDKSAIMLIVVSSCIMTKKRTERLYQDRKVRAFWNFNNKSSSQQNKPTHFYFCIRKDTDHLAFSLVADLELYCCRASWSECRTS